MFPRRGRSWRSSPARALRGGHGLPGPPSQSVGRALRARRYCRGRRRPALAIVAGITAAALGRCPAWPSPGLGTILLVQALARKPDGSAPVETMLLAGVTVSAVLNSLLMFIVSVAPSDKPVQGVVWWLLGNLDPSEWPPVAVVGTVVAVGIVIAILWARDLNLLALGDAPAGAPRPERLADPAAVLYRGLARDRGDCRCLRHHRLRRADRAACHAAAGGARSSPSRAGGRLGRRSVLDPGRLPRARYWRRGRFPSASLPPWSAARCSSSCCGDIRPQEVDLDWPCSPWNNSMPATTRCSPCGT